MERLLGWSICSGIGWSVSTGEGGQFTPFFPTDYKNPVNRQHKVASLKQKRKQMTDIELTKNE
jgi:hypothetical protein